MFYVNSKCVVSVVVLILIVFVPFVTASADITLVSQRTPQVQAAIVAAAGVDASADVTETHLTTISTLNLRGKDISELKSGDFSGLTGLTNLNLFNNKLSGLPDSIFEGLTALTTLRLGGNTVDPMQIIVSLEKVADGQFKAVAPTGAPFDLVLPVSATNGSIADNTTSLTISKGSIASGILTVNRTADTTAAVTVNIGTLPTLPANNHYGYTLLKSNGLPVEIISAEIISEISTTEITDPEEEDTTTQPVTPVTTTNAPVFTDGAKTTRFITENTAAETNIGTAVSATDVNGDTLTYSLSGTDALSFSIDSTTGQLETKVPLDYETKSVYSVTVTVSDGSLTDTIAVIIGIIDVSETTIVSTTVPMSQRTTQVRDAIVAAVPNVFDAADVTDTHLAAITALNLRGAGITSLQSGDFAGLSGLTNLNLYGNMLSSLPYGIFEGLTSLTSLRLGGNLIEPMPLIVSIQQVATGQFKVVISEGAPFDTSISVNGSTVTISQGSTASATFTSTMDVNLGALPSLPANHFGYILAKSAICNRTSQVVDTITAAVPNVTDCNNVTEVDLASITTLDLSSKSITSLQSDDFAGLLSMTTLDLSYNQLSSLPAGIFDGLTTLTSVDLSGNTADPISLSVSLEKVGTNQVKAVLPIGAPFSITLPISVVNGGLSSGTTLTIPIGSVESSTQTITRTPNTITAVTADIGTLPRIPTLHSGYALAKSSNSPLEIFKPINVAPAFTDGTTTARSIAENTDAGTNIGRTVRATDVNNDTLTYTLSGTDAASFSIVSTTGQLKTKVALDYETKTNYTVTTTVTDGSLTDTINVTINITDIDENRAPVFTDGDNTTRSVAENTAGGTNFGDAVSATDADNDTLTYSLSGPNAASFGIDTTSGQLKTSEVLDFETKNAYSVTITVSDGSLTDTITVTIKVTDADEDPTTDPSVPTRDTDTANTAPVFSEGDTTTRTVAEYTGSGVDIGSVVSATDAEGHTLTYSLGGTDAISFSLDTTSGQLRTYATLNYETKSSYSVTITVSDGNLTDTITVTVNITDRDETIPNNAPVFAEGSNTTRIIAENTGSSINIGAAVSATDADDNDTLTYTLSGTDASSFSIVRSSGQLRTSASLDYEIKNIYSVTVTASDGSLTDSITVTVIITDVEEVPSNNAPVFADGSSTTRSVAENTAVGTNIGAAVSATDTDDNDTLTYSLGGTDSSSFSIENSSGQLRTSDRLDYEDRVAYSVTINVSDGSLTDTITVTISVLNANDAPIFADGNSTTRAIAEKVDAGINIGAAVYATDQDGDTLIYSLGGPDASSFSLDNGSGQLKTSAELDYEDKNAYSVAISVSDSKGGSDTINVTISVTDLDETPSNNPPVFTDGNSTTRSVAENTVSGEDIGSPVSATDEDNNTLVYLLSGDDASAFSIDPDTGELKTSAVLDYEDKDSYSVTVSVSDGGLTDTISVTIEVTDVDENRAPVFAQTSTTRSVAENTAAGTDIGSPVSATDLDDDDLQYSLSGSGAASFSIDSGSGQLKTSASLNYEDKDSYSITVSASDGSLMDSIIVTIEVSDVDENRPPAFAEGSSTTRSVAENMAAGTDIGSPVSAIDLDNDSLTYSLVGSDASSFSIVRGSGQMQTSAFLDYEDESSYSVTVSVSDNKGGSDSIDVTIEVTDVDENRAPVFTQSTTTRSVAENSGSGVNIGTAVSATDPDDDNLEYTLGGTDASSFSIDSSSGQLRTSAALDYEDKNSYSVTVTASDGKLTDSIDVTISVTDVNENRSPVFTDDSTTRSVAENTASGTNIGAVISATDPDDDTLVYTLGGTDASSFSIDSTSGQLKTSTALDYEDDDTYEVTVTVSDGSLTDSIDVTVSVTDVNENTAPTFIVSSISSSISDIASASVGDSIGPPVTATDADSDTLTYSVGGTDASKFTIDSSSAQLKVTQALIDDTSSSYSIKVIATDPDNATAELSVTITVTRLSTQQQSINSAPLFDDGTSTTRNIAENTASGQNIGSAISATDSDGDTLTYSLAGTDASSFSIDSTSGQLRTRALLDYDTKSSYSVTISVSDGNSGTDSIAVTINVTEVTQTQADTTPPSVTISYEDVEVEFSTPITNGSFKMKITFSEPVKGFELSDLETDEEYTYSDFSAIDPEIIDGNSYTDTYTVTVIPDPNENSMNLSFYIEQGVATDTAGNPNTSANSPRIEIEKYRPMVEIIAPDSDVVTTTFTITIEFDGADHRDNRALGFTQSELSLMNNTAGATITGWTENTKRFQKSNGVLVTEGYGLYTAEITVTQSGSVTFSVAENVATDLAGNPNTAATPETVTITLSGAEPPVLPVLDTTPPSVTISYEDVEEQFATPVSYITNGSFKMKITFSEPVKGFELSDLVTDEEYTYSDFSAIDPEIIDGNSYTDTYTVTVIPDPNENSMNLSFYIEQGVATDTAGNPNTSANSPRIEIEKYRPMVEIIAPDSDVVTTTFTIKIEFDGADHRDNRPLGFTQSELSLTNNTAGATITNWTENTKRFGRSNGETFTGGYGLYTAEITVTQSGSVTFSVAENVATDLAGNPNTAATPETVTITLSGSEPPVLPVLDTTPPSVTISYEDVEEQFATPVSYITNGSFKMKITFSEPVKGFELSDLVTDDEYTYSDFSAIDPEIIDGNSYTDTYSVTVIPKTTDSTLYLYFYMEASVATDAAGNPNPYTSLPRIEIEKVRPTVVIEGPDTDVVTTTFTIKIKFDGADFRDDRPLGFTQSELSLTNNTAGATITNWTENTKRFGRSNGETFTGGYGLYTAEITVTQSGSVTFSVAENVATDLAGNLNTAATPETVTITLPNNQLNAPLSKRKINTALFPNFPNPFNPETWIPYHLANPSNVQINIYDTQGVVVRSLELGHQQAGYYTTRSRAAHWDGTNQFGEKVSNGIYFYQLQVDNRSLLRKMVILK